MPPDSLGLRLIGKMKTNCLGRFFFENKLLLQPDVVFDSESNGCNFSSLAPPGGEKKIFSIFFYKMTSLVGEGVFSDFFHPNESLKKVLPFYLFSKKNRPRQFVFILPLLTLLLQELSLSENLR